MAKTGKPLTMDRRPPDFDSAREDVAAHQATCSCHPVTAGCCDAPQGFGGQVLPRVPHGLDAGGREWHVDPLCRVRPEATRRLNARAGEEDL